MGLLKHQIFLPLGVCLSVAVAGLAMAADFPTKFSNAGGVKNSRHNLTQATTTPDISGAMLTVRNNYGEVCVYCHTPHSANAAIAAPLWNRTKLNTNYQTYDLLGTSTLTQTVSQPGANSLTCLSCHDGTIAIDSIINMPGSGRINQAAATSHQEAFLDSWTPPPGYATATTAGTHAAIGPTAPGGGAGCMACHSEAAGFATDFAGFYIGTDLRDDHPVGITFPLSGPGATDFNQPDATSGVTRYFDLNTNGKLDKGDIRLYDSGGGPEVECASCHDPHGVPSAGPASPFNPTFLRRANTGSAVCLTCHAK